MKTVPLHIFALALGLLLVSSPLFAHHGASAYETGLTNLKGTVTDYHLMNPHTELFFDVTGSSGKVEKWAAEGASALTMSRLGWTTSTFKPGDPITVAGNRAKNGSHNMRLRKVVLASGKEFIIERGEDYAGQ